MDESTGDHTGQRREIELIDKYWRIVDSGEAEDAAGAREQILAIFGASIAP